jgi:branched-chain amino acid aminotransferase
MVFRGNGGLYDPENHFPNYIIQTWPLVQADRLFNEKGLLIDIFPDGRKARDVFSNLKSNNYLVYAMAALYAKQRQLDDCLVLNSDGRVCDSTIANIFCIKNGIIYTTALSEGCVAGVMRRHVLEQVRQAGYPVFEKEIDTGFLQDADEIFLTNALQGLRWVKQFRESSYGNPITTSIHAIINKSIHY